MEQVEMFKEVFCNGTYIIKRDYWDKNKYLLYKRSPEYDRISIFHGQLKTYYHFAGSGSYMQMRRITKREEY